VRWACSLSVAVSVMPEASVVAAFHVVQPGQPVCEKVHMQHDRLPLPGGGQTEANTRLAVWVSQNMKF